MIPAPNAYSAHLPEGDPRAPGPSTMRHVIMRQIVAAVPDNFTANTMQAGPRLMLLSEWRVSVSFHESVKCG